MTRNRLSFAVYFLFVLFAAAAVIFPVCGAQASQFSGAYLRQVCAMDEKGRETTKGGHAVCQAYISGVIDYHNVLRAMDIAPRVDICVPEKIASYDLQKIVVGYLRYHAEHDGFNASPAVTMALYEVFPCK